MLFLIAVINVILIIIELCWFTDVYLEEGGAEHEHLKFKQTGKKRKNNSAAWTTTETFLLLETIWCFLENWNLF